MKQQLLFRVLLFTSVCVSSSWGFAQESEQPAKRDAEEWSVDAAVDSAVELLLGYQEDYAPDRPVGRVKELEDWQAKERQRLDALRGADGAAEWPYEGVYRVQGGVIPSGYRVGGTSIVVSALLEAGAYDSDTARASIDRALEFVLTNLEEDPALEAGPKKGYDVRGWGHTYALEMLLRALNETELSERQQERSRARVPELIQTFSINENPEGGWNYANNRDHSPFQTGATLLALFEAQAQGFDVDDGLITRALDALESGRAEDTGAFGYSGTREEPMHASAARAAVAELALERAGRSSPEELARAVAGFFDGWIELEKRKSQQGTHEGPYGIAPYYFFFGHLYAGVAIEHLPEAARASFREELLSVLKRTQEASGGWNDRIFPRTESVTTAMVVLALLAPSLEARPRWQPKEV